MTVGCLGVDRSGTGPQIRVGFVVSGPDGLYRAVLAGPTGPVQGEGRVTGGRGLVIVPTVGSGSYDDLVLTDVDTGQAVGRGPLGDLLPFAVRDEAVACDPTTLVAPVGSTTTTVPAGVVPSTGGGAASSTTTTVASTPDISTAAPAPASASTSTTDTPPWLLLAIPGVLLVAAGVVLLVRARSGSRSRPAT